MAKGWSFGALTDALKEGAFLDKSDIINIIYPVDIGIWFNSGVDPNTLFPGTTWVQQLTGRAVRMANSNAVGTGVGQIGATTGSDSVTLAVANLPAHTHTIAAHAHTMAHTHTINHTHSNGTATSAGAHQHGAGMNMPSNQDGLAGYGTTGIAGNSAGAAVSRGGSAANIQAWTSSGGAHTHPVTIPTFNGNSGGSSAANTGTGGPTATGSIGSGSAVNITNSSIYQAYWVRTN